MASRTPTFDWNQARAFLATAEAGSLSAAARRLGLTQPTLGRQVTALEQDLGVVLFERSGRSLTLTPSGVDLLDHARRMGDAADLIALTASGRSQDIEGQVAITASDIMATYLLPPMIERLRETAPAIEIEVVAANDIRDLRQREADIAIRHVRPEQPDLIARLVGTRSARLYAATRYLDRHGRPKSTDDLETAIFIGPGSPDRLIAGLVAQGVTLKRENFKITSESGVAYWQMVRHGLGIGVMDETVAAMAPEVECVLPSLPPFQFPVWLATHRELNTSRRIRLVFDLLAEEITNLSGT